MIVSRLILCGVVLALGVPANGEDPARIGDRPGSIPIYVGNMSVDIVLRYGGHDVHFPPNDPNTPDATPEGVRRLKDLGAFAVTDCLLWAASEPIPGHWDFTPYLRNADFMRANGLAYAPFCWVHYAPKWYQASAAFVPLTNLATGGTIPQLSLWSPDFDRVYDRYYRQLSAAMGDRISFLRLGMPSDYGELGFPAGMTRWLIPQPQAGPAFWCGDAYAKKDFRERLLARYGNLEALNAAWGTAFPTPEEIAMPDPGTTPARLGDAQARRYWLDFLDWYADAEDRTLVRLAALLRKYFPGKEIVASIGYGSERVTSGNDESRYLKTLGSLGLSCQSPAHVGFLETQSVASASWLYGVPYYTEPPGGMTASQVLDRIFAEISHGTECWFDYPRNLAKGRPALDRYRPLLNRGKPIIDVALWHPTADLDLRPNLNTAWSPPAAQISESLRDAIDYQVVDDRMIRDGALEKLKVKCLVLAGAKYLDRAAWREVLQWTRAGGFFLVAQGTPIQDETGARDLWRSQSVAQVPVANDFVSHQPGDAGICAPAQGHALFDAGAKKMGAGAVLSLDPSGLSIASEAELLATLCLENGAYRGDDSRNAAWILPPKVDGVYAVRQAGACIYYNSGPQPASIALAFRRHDFAPGAALPPDQVLALPARSIRVVPFPAP